MTQYYRVYENESGWRTYLIPTDVCPTKEDAIQLVEDCDAFSYLIDEETDSTSICSVELVEE